MIAELWFAQHVLQITNEKIAVASIGLPHFDD